MQYWQRRLFASQSTLLASARASGATWTCAAGVAVGVAADTFSKVLCTSLAQLRAVYTEAEHAGISLGDSRAHPAGVSLSSHLTQYSSLYVHTCLHTITDTMQSIRGSPCQATPLEGVLSLAICSFCMIAMVHNRMPGYMSPSQDPCDHKMQVKICWLDNCRAHAGCCDEHE